MQRSPRVWFATFLALVFGCAEGPQNVVCRDPLPKGYQESGHMSPRDWVDVLLSEATQEQDCTGAWIELPELPDRCPTPAESAKRTRNAAVASDLVVRQHGDGFFLVWAPTQRFENGDGGGPVGLVHLGKSDLSVIAIGMLRLPSSKVRLEMIDLEGATLLVAEGTDCFDTTAFEPCERVLRVLVLDQGRWMPLELRDARQACLGEAKVDLERIDVVGLDDGWRRKLELTATHDLTPEGFLMREQLVITDFPPGKDESQGRIFRRSQGRRTLHFTGAFFIQSEPSLWDKTRPSVGELD